MLKPDKKTLSTLLYHLSCIVELVEMSLPTEKKQFYLADDQNVVLSMDSDRQRWVLQQKRQSYLADDQNATEFVLSMDS
jgi:hypothetical protein